MPCIVSTLSCKTCVFRYACMLIQRDTHACDYQQHALQVTWQMVLPSLSLLLSRCSGEALVLRLLKVRVFAIAMSAAVIRPRFCEHAESDAEHAPLVV